MAAPVMDFDRMAQVRVQPGTRKALVTGNGATAKEIVRLLAQRTMEGGEAPLFDEIVVVGRDIERVQPLLDECMAACGEKGITLWAAQDCPDTPAADEDLAGIYGGVAIYIHTAGVSRGPDNPITREKLAEINVPIAQFFGERVQAFGDEGAKIVNLSNPMDTTTQALLEASGLQVVGLGASLDTERAYDFLAEITGLDKKCFAGLKVLGQHGEKMVLCTSALTLDGQPFELDAEQKQRLFELVKNEGARIAKATGHSDVEAPARLTVNLAQALMNETPSEHLLCARPSAAGAKAYGLNRDVCIGLTFMLSNQGAQMVVEGFSDGELAALQEAERAIEALNDRYLNPAQPPKHDRDRPAVAWTAELAC